MVYSKVRNKNEKYNLTTFKFNKQNQFIARANVNKMN